LRFESLVGTISRGTPGFTIAALMYAPPRSIPSTADAADAVEANAINKNAKRKKGWVSPPILAMIVRLWRGI
jgi:hypothetical protein